MINPAVDYDLFGATYQQIRMLRYLCEREHLMFNRVFHKVTDKEKFIVSQHHKILAEFCDKILRGEITRAIINAPPRNSKTLQCVWHLIARGLAINPRSRWMHLTGGEELALDNSKKIKSIVQSELYQSMWPMTLRIDSNTAGLWYTDQGGTVFAGPAGSNVMGFGAGYMVEDQMTGGLIVDDPIKPKDSFSDTLRTKINKQYYSTIDKRCALESTPRIILMQRIHDDDLSGFLLRGGTEETWDHLILPGWVDDDQIIEHYPEEWTHGVPYQYEMSSGPLWAFKSDEADQKKQEKADSYVYDAQQQQHPTKDGGDVFNDAWWRYADSIDLVACTIRIGEDVYPYQYINAYSDTAQKKGQHNDETVHSAWAKFALGILCFDLMHKRMESPELFKSALAFYDKYEYKHGVCNMGLRFRCIEDKSSGTGLIQDIRNLRGSNYITGVPRNVDKVSRANDTASYAEQGKIWLLKNAVWVDAYRLQFRKFNKLMTHKHDDMIDVTSDAGQHMLGGNLQLEYAPEWVGK